MLKRQVVASSAPLYSRQLLAISVGDVAELDRGGFATERQASTQNAVCICLIPKYPPRGRDVFIARSVPEGYTSNCRYRHIFPLGRLSLDPVNAFVNALNAVEEIVRDFLNAHIANGNCDGEEGHWKS